VAVDHGLPPSRLQIVRHQSIPHDGAALLVAMTLTLSGAPTSLAGA
jgi:hypothetical protein